MFSVSTIVAEALFSLPTAMSSFGTKAVVSVVPGTGTLKIVSE